MGRRLRECYLCSQKYEYCPSCSQDKMKPSWMTDFHEENCVKIFEICTRFNMNLMSKENAKSALNNCDLSNNKTAHKTRPSLVEKQYLKESPLTP